MPPFAILEIPSGGQTIKCSAETAPSSPAKTDPPIGSISSACILGVRPYLRPVSKIFRLSCALNTPVSQNTSQNLAIFCSATAGIISSHKRRIYASRFPLYSEGSAWAPIKVATTSTACPSCNFWIARSCFSSSSVVRPYPLLASQVVVPKDSISLNARDAFSVSSSSLADRVLLTVERIPPPWARISR